MFKPSIDFDDASYEFGALNLFALGVTNLSLSYILHACATDAGNGIMYIRTDATTGVIESRDVLTKDSSGIISAGNTIMCDMTYTIKYNYILASATGEFHFKRTA